MQDIFIIFFDFFVLLFIFEQFIHRKICRDCVFCTIRSHMPLHIKEKIFTKRTIMHKNYRQKVSLRGFLF